MWLPSTEETLSFIIQKRSYFFLVCVSLVFLHAGFYAGQEIYSDLNSYLDAEDRKWLAHPQNALSLAEAHSKGGMKEHPIPKLMADAEDSYRKKVSRQSRTLKGAAKEYRKRYHRDPPKGFDGWWQFAQENNVKLVDEYDGLVEDLAPFWEISGAELRRRTEQVGQLPSIDLVRVRDGVASAVSINGFEEGVSARATGFHQMLEKFVHKLSDMDLPINSKSEGRVLVPWEHRTHPNLTLQDSSAGIETMLSNPLIPDWRGDGNVWEAWRRTCSPTSSARRLFSSLRNTFAGQVTNYLSSVAIGPGGDFSFTPNTSSRLDYCSKPYAHYTQGHFFSDWRTITALYPVFSPAKAKGYMDIRIPSHYYYGSTKRYTYGWDPVNQELKGVDDMEVPWEEKIDKVFWRGASTGGGNNPPGFSPQYQRHRFVRMASDKSNRNRTITFADPPGSSRFVSVPVHIERLNSDVMDVAFVKAMDSQNYPGGLEAMHEDHHFGNAVELGRHWSYKYLLDLDGMSYSGRFMAYLASDSAVVKATVYEEYFSDWIQPWLHFIPLSTTYKEIYNIHAFFSGPSHAALESANSTQLLIPPERRQSKEGNRRLRRIARAGKQWKKTIGRTIDMEAYVYRLCLEWARLSADDRDSMNYKA